MKIKKIYIIATIIISFGMVGCSGQVEDKNNGESIAIEIAEMPNLDEGNNINNESSNIVEGSIDDKKDEPVEDAERTDDKTSESDEAVEHEATKEIEKDSIDPEKIEEQEKMEVKNDKTVEQELKIEVSAENKEDIVQLKEDKPKVVEQQKKLRIVQPAKEVDAVTAATDLIGGEDPNAVVKEEYGILNTKLTRVHKIEDGIYLTIVLHEGNDKLYDFFVNDVAITPNRINREGTMLRHALEGNEKKVTLRVSSSNEEEQITFSH